MIAELVQRVLDLTRTWPAWDGSPCQVDDRIYTPHKAVRRVADHMLDHLAELEARVAGAVAIPDTWHGSSVTTAADVAPFEPVDVTEAENRLIRLRELWRHALDAVPPDELDRSSGDPLTPRELAFHTAESIYYAEAVGAWPR